MAFVCASTDDVRAEAEQVFSDTGADVGFCALAGDTATVGLAAEWKDADRIGPELLGSKDAYRALMNGLTRIDAPYEFLGPQPMLSARLVARRLSDVASNRHRIVSVDGILPTEVARYAVLARLGVLPSMLYLSTAGQSRQLQAKGASKGDGFASDATQAAAFVTLVEQLAGAGECLLPASPSAPYTLLDALWFATSDEAQLRGNDVLRDALDGAGGLPAPSLALLMLYAACRHGKWQGKALLRLAASVAGEGAEALRGAGTVAPELYAALQLPEAAASGAERERDDCRELEAQVRDCKPRCGSCNRLPGIVSLRWMEFPLSSQKASTREWRNARRSSTRFVWCSSSPRAAPGAFPSGGTRWRRSSPPLETMRTAQRWPQTFGASSWASRRTRSRWDSLGTESPLTRQSSSFRMPSC